MNTSRGLLYPALHKFYSALNSLKKFEKGINFFENIGYLDNFFLEYRNITFVLQKSLAHTEFMEVYESLRDQYLVNSVGKWFVDKRNEVSKQQPFDLEKRIVITLYAHQSTMSLPELIYTIDNDREISSIIDELRSTFMHLNQLEVMFSVEFFFYEHGHTDDLFDNFIFGINQMIRFLKSMRKAIYQPCRLSDELENKIDQINFYRVPKDMLFVDDYIYYTKTNSFEKASRTALIASQPESRTPVENLNNLVPEGDLFIKFELMHLAFFQMQKTLMPTCFVVYNDNTFELLTFGFSIKTTIYRKLYEISKRLESDDIITVLLVTEMYMYDATKINNLDSRERTKYTKNEILAFYMVDNNLEIKIRVYDTERIDDWEYLASVMVRESKNESLPNFMNPIVREFERLQANVSRGNGEL